MIGIAAPTETTVQRRVFEAWSIQVPAAFAETFVDADGYWHAYDEHRSVSLTSLAISEEGDPVRASRIMRQAPPLDGSPVEEIHQASLGEP